MRAAFIPTADCCSGSSVHPCFPAVTEQITKQHSELLYGTPNRAGRPEIGPEMHVVLRTHCGYKEQNGLQCFPTSFLQSWCPHRSIELTFLSFKVSMQRYFTGNILGIFFYHVNSPHEVRIPKKDVVNSSISLQQKWAAFWSLKELKWG